jgi:hypothetical protein
MLKQAAFVLLATGSVMAFAGGPDDVGVAQNLGFSVGIQGGLANNTINSSSIYRADNNVANTTYEANFENSSSEMSGVYGAHFGWGKSFASSALSFDFVFNNLRVQDVYTQGISSNITPDGSFYQLVQSVKETQQYNLFVQWKYFIKHDFALFVSGGPSTLRVRTQLTVDPVLDTATNSGSGGSETDFLWGAAIGVGGEYFVGHHCAFNASAYYFIYDHHRLKTLTNSELLRNVSSLDNRKINISMPVFTLGYSYYF